MALTPFIRMSPLRGFALIELMIAIAVVAIAIVVALPSFQNRAVDGNRAAAAAVMRQVVLQQERWFAERRTYAPRLSLLGYPGDAIYIGSDGVPAAGASNQSHYRIRLAAPAPTGFEHCATHPAGAAAIRFAYVVIAEPQGFQSVNDANCGTICLYSTGQRGASNPVASDGEIAKCWAP